MRKPGLDSPSTLYSNRRNALGASGCSSVQQRAPALAEAGHLRTRKVNLPVRRYQHLYGFHLRIVRGQRPPRMRELVAQVVDCVAKNLQSAARLGRDAPAVRAALVRKRNGNRD